MSVKSKSIEEKYKSMDEITHILTRPGMWVGSIKFDNSQMFIYDVNEAKMKLTDVEYVPAMLKLIDEIISNSCDEFRRKENLGLNKIDITINKNGWITVRDNGGIPVVKHKEAGVYLQEFLFGQLRSSSNYDDTDDRDVVGTNGVGSALANVWAKEFIITSADNKKQFYCKWTNNMREHNDPVITKSSSHFTETQILLDYEKFDEDVDSYITDDFVSIIEKRCIDAAAANFGLQINFIYKDNTDIIREYTWEFKSFEEYIELYSNYIDLEEFITFSDTQKRVWIYPDAGLNIGFVNGAECSKGTHIKAIRDVVNNAVAQHLLAKDKIDIAPKDVNGKYSVFCVYHITNPSYDSQLKTCLTTPVERFSSDPKYKFVFPDSAIKQILKSEIVNIVRDWYNQKKEVEDQKLLRKLNKQAKNKIRNNEKFIDANSKKVAERELWIFEGDSAKSGFRMARDPQTQAAYMLRGVILNILSLSPSRIMENKELSDIITILGLQWGEKNNISKLNFGKIIISTDADFDGSKIAGLLIVFFNLFPELFEAGIVYRSKTPIITATKGNDIQRFFTLEEFRQKEKSLKGYKIIYNKGLGGLTNQEYKEMMRYPILECYTKDDMADINIKSWFGKGLANERKEMLKKDVES